MSMTEFEFLDPTEFHLVGDGASGFPALLAKAAADTVDGVLDVTGDLTKARWAGFCGEEHCGLCKEQFGPMHEVLVQKAKLKTKERNQLPRSAFAIPGERAYPIHDLSHARNALARVSQYGTPEEKKKVRAAVHSRYPDIEGESMENASKDGAPQSAHEDGSLPPVSGSQAQGKQNHPGAGPVPMGAMPHTTVPPFTGHEAPTADAEGHGSTAPEKEIPMREALSQTNLNLRKEGEGDGRGSPAPDGEKDLKDAESEARTQTEEVTRKAREAVEEGKEALAKAAEPATAQDSNVLDALVSAYKSVKAVMAAQKADPDAYTDPMDAQIWAHLEDVEHALKNALIDQAFDLSTIEVYPASQTTDQAKKEIDDMTGEELLKMLDDRDALKEQERKDAKKAQKKIEAKKAKKKAKAKAAAGDNDADDAMEKGLKALKKSAKGNPELQALIKGMESIDEVKELVKAIAAQPQPIPGVLNQAGIEGVVAAYKRGAAGAGSGLIFKERGDQSWSADSVRKELMEQGAL